MYKIFETFGLETGAFSQLTRKYMNEEFNPKTPNVDDVKYVLLVCFVHRCSDLSKILLLWSVFGANVLVGVRLVT
jgi:hypothetical protein